ncbi:putative minor capsid protein L2 [Four-toed hedgehog papillomavirus]|nr:putative minor capsid protein L2 [Four-toed hedgehog papillomavirus]
MALNRRRKRAAVEDIYRTCKVSGTCPPDVINKVENTTVADKILQYGSVGVFFGDLGIGTGRGGGGRTGYVPLGEGPGVRVGITPVRPSVSGIDTVGPRDILPVDAINPQGPSIIPLEDLPPAATIPMVVVDPVEVPPDFPVETFHVVTQPDTVSITPELSSVTTDGEGTAIIHVVQAQVHRSFHENPAFSVGDTIDPNPGESSASQHIFVAHDSDSLGRVVGEDIPLRRLSRHGGTARNEAETSFSTSTPQDRDLNVGPPKRRPGIYSRRYQQVEVTDPLFLSAPRKLVTFDNPVFEDPDITLAFEQDIADVTGAPHSDFADIIKLGRPQYSTGPDGRVRVSRIGSRGTIRTRSGAVIGGQAHFFQDISSILPEESIELSYMGEHSGEAVLVQDISDFDIIDLADVSWPTEYTDDELLDHIEDLGETVQLVIGQAEGRRSRLSTVSHRVRRPLPNAIDAPVSVSHPVYSPVDGKSPLRPKLIDPATEPCIIINDSGDFSLHVSLLRKRRKYFHA